MSKAAEAIADHIRIRADYMSRRLAIAPTRVRGRLTACFRRPKLGAGLSQYTRSAITMTGKDRPARGDGVAGLDIETQYEVAVYHHINSRSSRLKREQVDAQEDNPVWENIVRVWEEDR